MLQSRSMPPIVLEGKALKLNCISLKLFPQETDVTKAGTSSEACLILSLSKGHTARIHALYSSPYENPYG
jgi:hypothetical protein